MSANLSSLKRASRVLFTLVTSVFFANAHGGATALATEPFALSTKVNALPNIMYVLDNSGSMQFDYLPDWAGPYQVTTGGVTTVNTPAFQFFNSTYNGVAYNPGNYYRPPVMYSSSGALDTTTYPSMTGTSVATGGDSSASLTLPNWRAVKVDGYGVQSTSTISLDGNSFSFTTVAGEYCTTAQLRTCVASSVPTVVSSVSYNFPAKLRWCTTAVIAAGTTSGANTNCQASNIDNSAANIAAGVTPYVYARIPTARTSTITVGNNGTVNGITVDTLQILSASATGGTSTDVATAIAANINACTYVQTGYCTVVGYRATSAANVVTIAAPGATVSTPVVSGGSTAQTAFSGGNIPGVTLFNVITPTINSYPYPGTAVKSSNRSDCAGTTCTYSEEMTNYANWVAYYRTRMQMMKTAASIAFSNVGSNFRVGYFSINNATGSDFLNIAAFDGTQKNLWYTKFFSAIPFGATPLRSALANAGLVYAGKLSTLNGVAVNDPMQYSCQQNFTILSTDGYWNDANNPKQVDGVTDIGEQDGNDPRPYYDGATQTRTVSQTTRSDLQVGTNTFLVESRTQQQQTSTSQLDQTVVTKDIYPWTTQTTTLQTRTTPLNKTDYSLVQSTFPLISVTKQLQKRTYLLDSTPRILQSYINNLTKTTTPLEARTYNVTASTQLVTKDIYNLTVGTQLVTKDIYNLTVGTQLVTKDIYNLTKGTQLVTKDIYNVTTSTYPLQSSTYNLQASTRQLQQYMETSSNGGDTWVSTGWVDVTSCTVRASGPGYVRNTQCRYNTAVVTGGLSSCSTVTASPGPTNYTVAQAVTCAYETTPTVVAVGSCNVVAQGGSSPYSPSVACGYSASATVASGQASCTARDQSGLSSMSGDKVTCAYDSSATTHTTDLSTCTRVVPSPTASSPRTDCTYQSSTSQTGQTACTVAAQNNTVANGQVVNAAVTCAYDSSATTHTTGLSTCTRAVPSPDASSPKTVCTYQSATSQTGQTACTAAAQNNTVANGQVVNTAVTCAYDSSATSDTTGLSTCTRVVPSPDASSPKTVCTYQSATNQSGLGSCTAAAQNNTVANGQVANAAVTCAYDGSPTTTLTNQSSCTWVVPSPSASAPRTDCVYNSGAASTATVASCSTVAQSSSSGNGAVWSGPAVACAYQAAVLVSTNLTTCTAGTPSGSSPYSAYTTCGYINGTTITGQNSCTKVADSPGPTNYSGPANACAYESASTPTTPTNVTSCLAVAQDTVNFSAPQVTCAYETVGTSATNLSTCTHVAQSSGGGTWTGPGVDCSYSGTANTSTPSTCTVNVEAGPSYSNGAKITCAYASGVTSNNVGTCTAQAKQTLTASGTVYNPAEDCGYGSTSGWSNASVACVPLAQSAGPSYTGPARDCQYTSPSVDTYTATCSAAAQNNTNLTARNCVAGAFPVTISTVTSTVNSCSTAPTTNGATPVERITNTTCAYRTPVVTNTATCTPVAASGSSPYISAVTCPVSDTGWVAVAPSCTLAGTAPASFDGTGKIVQCRKTDQLGTTSTSDFTTFTLLTQSLASSCTPGTDAGTKVQTRCTTLLSTGPDPVQTCTTVDPAVAPSYVKTTCSTNNLSSTVMGCTAQAATSPLWQTVTCTYDGTGTYNTLADVAAHYYKTDLRTPALNNCTGAVVPPSTSASILCTASDVMNNVPTTTNDPNSAQHMTTFTLGLGASGYMQYSSTYNTDTSGDFPTVKGVSPYLPANGIAADPANGICSWQSTGNCNWPVPVSDQQTGIDDLWHAGVNGHGAYFSATDPVSLSNSISTALSGVAAAGGASASPTISNLTLTSGDNYIFSSTYTSLDWTGELIRRQLDPYTSVISTNTDWSVQAKLDAKAYTARNIYTFNATATNNLKPFTSANFASNSAFLSPNISTAPNGLTQFLCSSALVCLSASDQDSSHAAGANLVNFLRGDRSNEGVDTDNTKYYRLRAHVLGDMVNAQIVYVNKPLYNYADPGYSTFVTAQSSRQAVAYAGANDGMLHAFAAKGNASTEALVAAAAAAYDAAVADPTNATLATAAATASASAATAVASDTVIGQELWAYIPSMVLPNLYHLADKKYKDLHRYYVDATPVAGDICASNCTSSSAVWKTILVGGLGRGGRGYYALDITDPANPKALWEFTDDNIGYTFGNPQIAKMSDGTWVVLLTSGYNNIPNDDGSGGDGIGRLYILNAVTGVPIPGVSPISTGYGSVSDPSGLAKITAQVVNPASDNTVQAVYGGDLSGNLWRFDINNSIGLPGVEAQLLATLMDGQGNRQPITGKPEVGLIKTKIVVFVGTGRFLAASDATDTSQQSLYAIYDPMTGVVPPTTAIYPNPGGQPRTTGASPLGFVQQILSFITCPVGNLSSICAQGSQIITSTNNPVDYSTNNGWFIDLINPSERVNTDPAFGLGLLAFVSNAPTLLACDIGGQSYSYNINYLTGGPIYSPGNGTLAANNGMIGKLLANELASSPSLIVTKSGTLQEVIGLSGGGISVTQPPLPPPADVLRRTSWRELISD